jgi:hypothetical protein
MAINTFLTSGKDLTYKLPWAKGKEDVWIGYSGDDGGPIQDIFVHLHGYLPGALVGKDSKTILSDKKEGKVRVSGMVDRTTLEPLSLPRNSFMIVPNGLATGNVVKFDTLDVSKLVDACLDWWDDQTQMSNVRNAKWTITAHSGGGAALNQIALGKLGNPDPDALWYFDATYNAEPKLKDWAGKSGKQLCVAYIDTGDKWTTPFAKTTATWKLPKFRIAQALCVHEDVPFYAFTYFLTGKTSDPKKLAPPTCTPL